MSAPDYAGRIFSGRCRRCGRKVRAENRLACARCLTWEAIYRRGLGQKERK